MKSLKSCKYTIYHWFNQKVCVWFFSYKYKKNVMHFTISVWIGDVNVKYIKTNCDLKYKKL
jgi:hypothetical protein